MQPAQQDTRNHKYGNQSNRDQKKSDTQQGSYAAWFQSWFHFFYIPVHLICCFSVFCQLRHDDEESILISLKVDFSILTENPQYPFCHLCKYFAGVPTGKQSFLHFMIINHSLLDKAHSYRHSDSAQYDRNETGFFPSEAHCQGRGEEDNSRMF